MPLYFAFGSNLDADQMAERCPGARAGFAARLPDHRIAFTHASKRWGGGAADILPAAGESMWGLVWELGDHHLMRLDAYEGGYERVALSVFDRAGTPHAVVSYRVCVKGDHRPTRHYLAKMLHWAERWSLPDEYLEHLRDIATLDG